MTGLPDWLLTDYCLGLSYLILCLLSLGCRQKHWNEGMRQSLGNSWHFVQTHKHQLKILSIVKNPNRGLEVINLELENLFATLHLQVTC